MSKNLHFLCAWSDIEKRGVIKEQQRLLKIMSVESLFCHLLVHKSFLDPFYSLDTCVHIPNQSQCEVYFKEHYVKLNLNRKIM